MTRLRLALAATALIALSSGASADDIRHRKAGLWDLTTQPSGMPQPILAKLCIDAATDTAFDSFGKSNGAQCSRHEVTQDGDRTTFESVCVIDGRTVTTHGELTWTGDTAYHMDSQSHSEPPFMGQADRHNTQDGTWLGECPADMVPGDMTMGNGMKMNITNMGMARP